MRTYLSDALAQSGDQFNKALQDLINHVGHLLGFDVVYGRYRGVKGEIGYDGLWRSSAGWSIVVETKTTDVYTIKTSTLLGYINSLVSEGEIENPSNVLGLYAFGRFDAHTNQLENAIIVEGRRERLRVVSVDALLNLLELKQEYDLKHNSILGLLLPAPVKVDALVNLIFDIVAQEKEEGDSIPESEETETPEQPTPVPGAPKPKGPRTTLVSIDESYTGMSARAVVFRNKRYEVSTWKEAALAVFEALRLEDQEKFERVAVTIIGRKRPYITHDGEKLRSSGVVPGTQLFFETNLSANSLVKLCYTLIAKMGHKKSALRFEAEE